MKSLALALAVSLAFWCGLSSAQDGGTKKARPKLDISMPSMGEVPTADGLVKHKEAKLAQEPTTLVAGTPVYAVVKVVHARQFSPSASGARPISPVDSVAVDGAPPTSEKFSTAVRVKCPQRSSAPIEIAILDPRGDTAMSNSGTLTYRGAKGDEAEYVVDWEPTPMRQGGDFSVMVRIGGQSMGIWPLKVTMARR